MVLHKNIPFSMLQEAFYTPFLQQLQCHNLEKNRSPHCRDVPVTAFLISPSNITSMCIKCTA